MDIPLNLTYLDGIVKNYDCVREKHNNSYHFDCIYNDSPIS